MILLCFGRFVFESGLGEWLRPERVGEFKERELLFELNVVGLLHEPSLAWR